MLLSKAVEGYFYDKSATYSPKTLEAYTSVFKHLVEFIGDWELDQIKPDDLKRFIHWLQNDYVPHRFNGDTSPLTPSAVELHWKGVRSLFGWANKTLDIPRPDMDMPRPRFERAHVVPFTEIEIRCLLKACANVHVVDDKRNRQPFLQRIPTAHRNKALLLLLLDTGLRLGEALRLTIQDVNFETGEILVTPFGTGKKTKPRMVMIGNTAKRALWLYVAKLEDSRPADRLFPISPVAVRIMMRRLSRRSGVPNVHPHRFRHTFAIWYLRNGGDVFTLQRLLGHRTIEMVLYYLDIAQSDIALAHQRASAVDRWNANQAL